MQNIIETFIILGIMVVNAMMLCYMAIGISIFMAHKKEKKAAGKGKVT